VRNITPTGLEQRLGELSDEQEIVAYCRGAYCVFAFEAVSILRRHGFKVRQLEDGFPGWKAAGVPGSRKAAWRSAHKLD